ncbi:MAG: twin transmembrane helix small protein [Burkholderiales bacterium]
MRISIYTPMATGAYEDVALAEKEEMMNFFTVVVLAAMLATVFALISGITSMASDGEVGHADSGRWMTRRVAFQAIAFLLVLVSIYLTR